MTRVSTLLLSFSMMFVLGCGRRGSFRSGGLGQRGLLGARGVAGDPDSAGPGLAGTGANARIPGQAPTAGIPGQPTAQLAAAGPGSSPLRGNEVLDARPGGTAPADPARDPFDQAVEQEMLNIVNGLRQQNGAGPLRLDPNLGRAAAAHSAEQARQGRYFHGNFQASAENVAQNVSVGDPRDLAQKFIDWYLTSPPHRANILNPGFTAAGFGAKVSGGGTQGQAFNTMQFS